MSVVDDIKQRLDIVQIVGQSVQLENAGRNKKGLCPFHSEKTPSFVVFPDKQTWRCFGQCGEGGDAISFVMKQSGLSFSEAIRKLGKEVGIQVEDLKQTRSPEQSAKEDRLYGLLKEAARFFHEQLSGSVAEDYLQKRGLSTKTAENFLLGYAPDDWDQLYHHLAQLGYHVDDMVTVAVVSQNKNGKYYDRFRHRFMIPIRDSQGRVVGFGARALRDEDQPKYLNSPQTPLFDKSRLLFGLPDARRAIRESETAVIVEGYLDVIQAHQAGFQNVVATMGTALTREHIQLLNKYVTKLVLALDTDAAGIKATMRGLEVMREVMSSDDVQVLDVNGVLRQAGKLKMDVRVLRLPYGKDPDEFIRAKAHEWQGQVQAALPLATYLIETAAETLPPNASVMEREKMAHQLLPIIMTTENRQADLTNVQYLSLKLHLDERAMVEWVRDTLMATPVNVAQFIAEPLPKKIPTPRLSGAASLINLHPKTDVMSSERHCLSILLRKPYRLSELNGIFKHIAHQPQAPLYEPLNASDFTQIEFQTIFLLLEEAVQQYQLDPLDYLLEKLDPALKGVLDEILLERIEISAHQFDPVVRRELISIQTKPQRRSLSQAEDDFIDRLMNLRLIRGQRESAEITYLLKEAEHLQNEPERILWENAYGEICHFLGNLYTLQGVLRRMI